MHRTVMLGAFAVAATSMPVIAGERTAYASIMTGDLSRAEATLTAERRIYPDRPELMLNLAAVYQRTGRPIAAAALYREVLVRPAVTMDMPSGAVRSSHAVADAALARLSTTAIASR